MKKLDFSITSEYEEVSSIRAAVAKSCSEYLTLNDLQLGNIELAIAEALNNVIEHSYAGEPDNQIEIRLELTGTSIAIHVFDCGESMPMERLYNTIAYTEVDEPASDDKDELYFIEQAMNESGKGIKIIKSVMDEVVYSSADGRNHMIMKLLL